MSVFLPDQPGVYTLQSDSGDVLGQFLPGQRLGTSQSVAGVTTVLTMVTLNGGCEPVDRYIQTEQLNHIYIGHCLLDILYEVS